MKAMQREAQSLLVLLRLIHNKSNQWSLSRKFTYAQTHVLIAVNRTELFELISTRCKPGAVLKGVGGPRQSVRYTAPNAPPPLPK